MVKNDGVIIISYGKSRQAKKYKIKSVKWSELLNKFKNTMRTNETVEEFKLFSKQLQDDVKDVGGFVGGLLIDGKRSKSSVQYRSLVTLDIDFADKYFLDKIRKLDFAYCIYSTHKHGIPNERYRLVIPLETAISPNEYEYISRKIAEMIGISYFDQSTFQPERLMYWPSTCKDGEFVFEFSDKPWLKIKDISDDDTYKINEEIIKDYDKNDNKESKAPVEILKALDNTEKKNIEDKDGVIGAFLRSYNIYEAIDKFLADVYIKGIGSNRFTYYNSTTSNGFVILEDGKYGYSHHSSDPAGNKLCDAFDLVRIHKFYKDNEKESYKDMIKFALNDEKVRADINKRSLEEAKNTFANIITPEEEKNDESNKEWLSTLECDDNGNYSSSLKNINIILENDENLKGKIAQNDFVDSTCIIGDLPWHEVQDKNNGDLWSDCDDAYLRLYLEQVYKISSPNRILDGVTVIADKNKYHPIRDYLDGLKWDGIERLDTLFCDYFGAVDNEYVRTVTRKSFVAAVARVFNPGIKFDYMLILSGEQGIGKSHIFQALGKGWYSDSLTTVIGKEAYEQLQGIWLIEMAELAPLKTGDSDSIKLFISKSDDIYRNAYGRRVKKYPRQCVFFGTTNREEFLKDSTGNRRFWPIKLGERKNTKDVWQDLDQEVDQIWAEAYLRYKEGEKLYLENDLKIEASLVQSMHMISDSKEGLILEFIEKPVPRSWCYMTIEERKRYISCIDFADNSEDTMAREKVCALEIWVELLNGDIKMFNRNIAREINDILSRAEGWKSYSKSTGRLRFGSEYGVQKAFVRISNEEKEAKVS